MGQVEKGHSEGRVACRRALPTNRLHRNRHEQKSRECGPVLQQARHPPRLQPGEARPVHPRVQIRELHSPLRTPEQGFSLVSLKHTAQARQDRAKVTSHSRMTIFQMAEVAVSEALFAALLVRIGSPAAAPTCCLLYTSPSP